MKIVSTTITTILLTISSWSQAFTTTTSTTKAFYPTKSIGIANTRFRGSSSTELHVVDVNSLVQLSVLFGAGATVFYLGDNPMTNANASSNTEANANAFKNVSVVADLEKENSKNIGDELVADVIGEPIEALTALDEETADVIAETLVEVKEIEEVVAAVDEKKKKEEEKKKKEEEEIARKKAIEAERNADMQRAREIAAQKKQKEEEEKAAKIAEERKADMEAARKLAAERAQFSGSAPEVEENETQEKPATEDESSVEVETVPANNESSLSVLRKKAVPLLVASLVVTGVVKIAKIYFGRGML